MNILVMNDRGGTLLALNRQRSHRLLAGMGVALVIALGVTAYLSRQDGVVSPAALLAWQERLAAQAAEIDEFRDEHHRKLQALSQATAKLNVRLANLQAVGSRVIEQAGLEGIDFHAPLAVGGPEMPVLSREDAEAKYALFAVVNEIERLRQRINEQQGQMELIDRTLFHKRTQRDAGLDGNIVDNGRLTSGYGLRRDPFDSRRVWHLGMDIASAIGAPIHAAAAGIVTRAGLFDGYGLLVEINHGGGFVTRYAHNRENMVSVGDVVDKRQVVAKMGNSGRSTGPHVHFEVRKNRRAVNPLPYMPEFLARPHAR